MFTELLYEFMQKLRSEYNFNDPLIKIGVSREMYYQILYEAKKMNKEFGIYEINEFKLCEIRIVPRDKDTFWDERHKRLF